MLSCLVLTSVLWWLTAPSYAQNIRINIPLTLTDRLGNADTVHFGVDDRATYCDDPALGESPTVSACGDLLVLWLCGYFANPRGYDASCFDGGMFTDLRGFSSHTQVDTFLLRLQDVDSLFPVTIHWPRTLNVLFDSARILDPFGGVIYNADMLTNDSLIVTTSAMFMLRIITYGPKTTVDVPFGRSMLPVSCSLSQNLPNPFNPSTTIRYSTDRMQHILLTVYDVFGREIAKLVDETKPPGVHQCTWNAVGCASGVYFCRLLGERSSETTKMTLVR